MRLSFLCLFLGLSILTPVVAQKKAARVEIPSPKSVLGFEPADDRTIADWGQIRNYFGKLDSASPRVKVETLGETTLGKPFIVAFISSEQNIRNLNKYKAISQKLADPRTIKTDAERNQLIAAGKTIVSISCSIHSTEIVGSQMSMLLAHQMASENDPQTTEILNNTILILTPSMNPDGIDIVANWYRKTFNSKFEGSSPPELYHHYAGHDNNRDWFMLNLKETRLITNLFWKQWFPQIVYDVHQMGSNGVRFVIPPFFDPPNPNIPPLVLREVGLMGYKMAADLQAAGVKGVATNTVFDTWWHGGFRSTPYYHNSIGILSEAASADLMTPKTITEETIRKSEPGRGLKSVYEPATNNPDPWLGGLWRPRDIANIELTASRALLSMAAKYRIRYLKNFSDLNLKAANPKEFPTQPQAYLIPPGQPNSESVSRMIEILMAQGIEVYEMLHELHVSADGKAATEYPLGSYLVFTNQPQRANVQALFERQVYPHRLNANGEAEVPYDVAGWTLPMQMGVESIPVTKIVEPDISKHIVMVENINDVRKALNLSPAKESFAKITNPLKTNPKIGLYRDFAASMDEGWTRFMFDSFQIPFSSLSDADVRAGKFDSDVIVLPSQSERDLKTGLRKEDYPEEYTGGLGDKGFENLKRFVERGGKLICFDASCGVVIKEFDLPIKNVLTGLKRNEFYCPGSILSLDVDRRFALAKGLSKQTPAYFINSSAFEIKDDDKVASIAKYADKDALLSGWILGEKYLNGKTALAEAKYGKGKVILFAFRPQHRGQTWGTFPFVFNALEK